MQRIFNGNYKLGILGAGQLGKMMALAVGKWHLPLYALDKQDDYPAVPFLTGFSQGNFGDEADVFAFGKEMDALTIEIEHVNTDALRRLRSLGKKVHPDPDVLDIIKDKGLQKQFYAKHDLDTSPFQLFDDTTAIQTAIETMQLEYPFVQKARSGGYDGKGVAIIRSAEDKLLEGPSLIEPLVDIEKELAVIVARNPSGDIRAYPPVEMVFNPLANLVELLLCPAAIEPLLSAKATELTIATAQAYQISGLLAVELFLTKSGDILINEVAPRPHNSGHHTIESCITSQFEQHIRGVLDLPLGDTQLIRPAVMLNLLGADGHEGPTRYEGMDTLLSQPGVFVHLYGKFATRPFRKMGHITITGNSSTEVLKKADLIKDQLQVVS